MSIVEDGGVLRAESDENLQKFVGDPQLIHYAGMLNPPRPGVQDCFQMLDLLISNQVPLVTNFII